MGNKDLASTSKSPIRTNKQQNASAVFHNTSVSPNKKQNIPKQIRNETISDRYQIGKFLGKGKFSDVFQAL